MSSFYVKQINHIHLRSGLPLMFHDCQELVSINKPINGKVEKEKQLLQPGIRNLKSQVMINVGRLPLMFAT